MGNSEKKIEIIYEDKGMLVVNKPAGMVTTNENTKNGLTLETWLKNNYKIDLPRSGLVHRLDKGTSGLVIVAKDIDGLKNLQSQFKKRSVVKKYVALVSNYFPFEAEVNMPIGRSKYRFDCFSVHEDGKNARTVFKLDKIIKIENKIYSLVEADLKTGRTHQIRVHLKFLKYPIVGDEMYGGEKVSWLSRIFLHAKYVEIISPVTQKLLKLEAGLPDELAKWIKE